MIIKRNWRDAHPTIAHDSGADGKLLSSTTKTSRDIEEPHLDPKCRCLKAITYVFICQVAAQPIIRTPLSPVIINGVGMIKIGNSRPLFGHQIVQVWVFYL
jgi:hypothetical protein